MELIIFKRDLEADGGISCELTLLLASRVLVLFTVAPSVERLET